MNQYHYLFLETEPSLNVMATQPNLNTPAAEAAFQFAANAAATMAVDQIFGRPIDLKRSIVKALNGGADPEGFWKMNEDQLLRKIGNLKVSLRNKVPEALRPTLDVRRKFFGGKFVAVIIVF